MNDFKFDLGNLLFILLINLYKVYIVLFLNKNIYK